ncbi:MAG: hypothetical protein K2X32_15750 [Phycisphaerales bacterium]|nr:hypothetical protein [Phycisphaerales bacterium]
MDDYPAMRIGYELALPHDCQLWNAEGQLAPTLLGATYGEHWIDFGDRRYLRFSEALRTHWKSELSSRGVTGELPRLAYPQHAGSPLRWFFSDVFGNLFPDALEPLPDDIGERLNTDERVTSWAEKLFAFEGDVSKEDDEDEYWRRSDLREQASFWLLARRGLPLFMGDDIGLMLWRIGDELLYRWNDDSTDQDSGALRWEYPRGFGRLPVAAVEVEIRRAYSQLQADMLPQIERIRASGLVADVSGLVREAHGDRFDFDKLFDVNRIRPTDWNAVRSANEQILGTNW